MWTDRITCRACSLAPRPSFTLPPSPAMPDCLLPSLSLLLSRSLSPLHTRMLCCSLFLLPLPLFSSLSLSLSFAHLHSLFRKEDVAVSHPFSFRLPFFLPLSFDWFSLSLLFHFAYFHANVFLDPPLLTHLFVLSELPWLSDLSPLAGHCSC